MWALCLFVEINKEIMHVPFMKGDVRDEKTSKKMLSQSEIQKKMATEAAAAAEKLAAKKAAKVEEARKRAAAAAAKQAATDKLLKETLEHVMAQAVEEQPKLRGAWAAKAKLRRAIAMDGYIKKKPHEDSHSRTSSGLAAPPPSVRVVRSPGRDHHSVEGGPPGTSSV